MAFKPLHDRVLVRRVEGEEKTKGGLIIPDNAKEKPAEGEVIACGDGARKDHQIAIIALGHEVEQSVLPLAKRFIGSVLNDREAWHLTKPVAGCSVRLLEHFVSVAQHCGSRDDRRVDFNRVNVFIAQSIIAPRLRGVGHGQVPLSM